MTSLRRASLSPDRRGLAQTENGSFRAKNASQYGVVYGALMEFEVTLRGPAWLGELRKLGAVNSAAAGHTIAMPLTMRVGAAEHAATAQVTLGPR